MDKNVSSKVNLNSCVNWLKSLDVNLWSRYAYYPACKALCETTIVIEAWDQGKQLFTLRFKKPIIEFIPRTDPRYNAISSLLGLPREGYNPDMLGLYLPYDTFVDNTELYAGIYLHIDNIKDYWRETLSKLRLFNVNTLLALVFYHEYLHMIMDKLGIAHQYQNKKLTLELEDYDQINYSDYEEALAEFYALTKTLFDPLILPDLGVDLSHSICEPVKTIFTTYDPPHLKGIKVNVEETIAYQPVSYTKFISLKRPHPYSLVNDLWKDYFSNVIINKLLKYSVIAGSGFKAAKVISPIAKLPLIEKPYEYLFKKIFDLFTLNDNWADRENSFDVHVYLVGVDENEIFNLNLSCNDLA